MTAVRKRTLIQEDLFPASVDRGLRVPIVSLMIPVQGGQRRDVLFNERISKIRNQRVHHTSTSRSRISDFLLPFLIEPARVIIPIRIDPERRTNRARYRCRDGTITRDWSAWHNTNSGSTTTNLEVQFAVPVGMFKRYYRWTMRGTYQLGSLLPAFESSRTKSKNSSTEWPMLTGGNSREVLLTARIRRSCENVVNYDI